jgi:hypothetical protein
MPKLSTLVQGPRPHIHIKVHVGSAVVHARQIFFDDKKAKTSMRPPAYRGRGRPRYDEHHGSHLRYRRRPQGEGPTQTASGQGLSGQITVGVRS